MKAWEERPIEEAHLFNPAFCGEIVRRAIHSYNQNSQAPFPFPLAFIILPIVLHKDTRTKISNTTREQFHVWLQNNPQVRYGFGLRAKALGPIAYESVTFLLKMDTILVSDTANLRIRKRPKALASLDLGDEVRDCFRKAEIVGRWFARAGSVGNIYTMLGVAP